MSTTSGEVYRSKRRGEVGANQDGLRSNHMEKGAATAQRKVSDADVTRLEGRMSTKPPQGRWIQELEERATSGERSRSR